MKNFRYSVAIRTLGKAGEAYQKELDSLDCQSIRPEKIVVYLAEGYEKPKETIGWEEIVFVKKGMVAQRALKYEEISSPYILMLDDDVYLPNNAVETMARSIIENNGDCIAADTFPNHRMSLAGKFFAFVTNWACPIYSHKWAIKIQLTGSFCYNNHPTKNCYLAQSAAGPCSLWKKKAFVGIRFEDEMWLDRLGFAYGDDLLYYYKLYLNGGKMLLSYDSGVEHLDAQSSRAGYNKDSEKLRKRARAWFLLWWRISYSRKDVGIGYKIMSLVAYALKFMWGAGINALYGLSVFSYKPLWYHVLGNIDGYRYVHSDEYDRIPNIVVS